MKVKFYGECFPVHVGPDGKIAEGARPLWNDDWGKAISRKGVRQQYDLSVRGGSDHTRYYVSGGYLNEEGWIRGSGYERYNFRTNLHSKINDWIDLRSEERRVGKGRR